MIYLKLLMVVLAGVAKAFKDRSAAGTLPKSWGTFWDERFSWVNKWKDKNPHFGEAFPGSTTVFVSLTSGFHLAQLVEYNLLIAALILIDAQFQSVLLIEFLIISAAFRIPFELTHRLLGRLK